MALLGELSRGWVRKRYKREATALLTHLRSLEDKDMGLVLAIAAHQRNVLIKEGVAMRDLTALNRDVPMYQHDLQKAIQVLINKKRPHDALGIQIWMHSLRALSDPALYVMGVAIWRELARGIAHVAKARTAVKKETGFDLDIAMAGEIPSEFADED